MSLYKEKTTAAGTTYCRVGSFSGYNEFEAIPKIIFNEQEISLYVDGTKNVKDGIGQLPVELTDLMQPLILLNPLDDSVLDDATLLAIARTYGMVQIVLYSLYRAEAAARDARDAGEDAGEDA